MNSLTKLCLLCFLVLNLFTLYAQKEANIWYFGHYAGLDFNSGSPVALTSGQLTTLEGCATISDNEGNLLFYTDGRTVYNKNHDIMLNGMFLNGNDSSTNSALIVPKPDSDVIYYIFTVDYQGGSNGIQFSEVDMQLDGGLGIVTANKNIKLFSPITEKITAIKGCNGSCIWVVTHKINSSEFLAYKVTSAGVDQVPVASNTGSYVFGSSYAIGAIKLSPKGDKLAVANFNQDVQLFDFNVETGVVSNPIILLNDSVNNHYYGIEFSPSGNLLYVSMEYGGIYQFNLNAGATSSIINSITEITLNPVGYGALQLAVNGKIYATQFDNGYLHAINNPNALGLACNYQPDSVFLQGKRAQLGLPPFIQSYFNLGAITFSDTCFGDNTSFALPDSVDSAIWDFGDPASGASNNSTDIQPTHVFTASGTYEVSVTATVGTETATETITVTIYQPPTATIPYDIIICDYVGDLYIDLVSHSPHILGTLDPDVFGINFYEGMDDFNNGYKIANPSSHLGPSSFYIQEIIAEVYHKGNPACTDIVSFNVGIDIKPKLKPHEQIPNLTLCDDVDSGSDTDGKSIFDLTQLEAGFLAEPMTGVVYKYYLDAAFAQPIAAPEAFTNTQNPQTIYFEGINNSGYCRDKSSFTIQVQSLPQVDSVVTLKQCDDDLDGFSAFNLNEVISKITLNAATETISFFESPLDAENNNNPIPNPTTYINQTVSSDVVWARIENESGCYRNSQVNLVVSTTQIPNTYVRDFYMCDDDNDGITTFDFSSVGTEIEAMFPAGQQLTITYYRNGTDALAEVNQIVDISNYQNMGYPNSQQIYVRVDSQIDNDCLGLGAHINLHVEPLPVANPVTIQRQCDDDNDGLFSFDVSHVQANVLNGQSLLDVTVSYFDSNNNPLPSPLPSPFLTGSQVITIRVTNNNVSDRSCYDETTLEFIVDAQPMAHRVLDQIACDDGVDDTDGLHEFDTSLIESTILNGQTGMVVHYFNGNGIQLPSPLPNPFLSGSQTITAHVVNLLNSDCYATTSFNLTVNPLPRFSVETPLIVCSSDPTFTVVLNPIEEDLNELFDYEWTYEDGTVLSNDPTITVSTPGSYSVRLTKTDGTGCSRIRNIFVNASELATISMEDITIVDNTDSNSITINTSNLGLGDYEFALNDEFGLYQVSPHFSNVRSGIHTIYIRDKKGCGTSSIEISLIGYPKYFTPNGDGIHDYWKIDGINDQFQTKSDIFIYDRYGKLIKQLAPASIGWDGTLNGRALSADDYWFNVFLEDGREFKGHFALRR